jgi:hypothetical protein
MEFINKELQDYFIKMAPDFSVFEMIERYYYDNNDSFGDLADIMYYNKDSVVNIETGFREAQTHITRGMFLIYSEGDISVKGSAQNEYTVFPYKKGTQILIAVKDTSITIESDTDIEMIVGVAF